jgi:hypothetical protein
MAIILAERHVQADSAQSVWQRKGWRRCLIPFVAKNWRLWPKSGNERDKIDELYLSLPENEIKQMYHHRSKQCPGNARERLRKFPDRHQVETQ